MMTAEAPEAVIVSSVDAWIDINRESIYSALLEWRETYSIQKYASRDWCPDFGLSEYPSCLMCESFTFNPPPGFTVAMSPGIDFYDANSDKWIRVMGEHVYFRSRLGNGDNTILDFTAPAYMPVYFLGYEASLEKGARIRFLKELAGLLVRDVDAGKGIVRLLATDRQLEEIGIRYETD